jgi:hypothetical protein
LRGDAKAQSGLTRLIAAAVIDDQSWTHFPALTFSGSRNLQKTAAAA